MGVTEIQGQVFNLKTPTFPPSPYSKAASGPLFRSCDSIVDAAPADLRRAAHQVAAARWTSSGQAASLAASRMTVSTTVPSEV